MSQVNKPFQIDLFNQALHKEHDWKDEWLDMPEYNNTKPQDPEITATFKFKNKEYFEKFMEVVKRDLYNNQRVFDGKQFVNDYTTWYPLDSRPSEFIYILNYIENEK